MSSSISSLKKQLLKIPNNTALLGALAESYRSKGLLPLAIETCSQIIKIEPNNYQVLNNLGALQRNTGDIKASYSTLSHANQVLPNNPIILTNLANTLLSMGRHDLAVECAQNAVNLQPDFFDSNEILGQAYVSAGNYSEAITRYQKALTLQPKNKACTLSLARAYHFSGDDEHAYETLKPVLNPVAPACATLFFDIGKKIGKQKEAVDYLHKSLKVVPRNDNDAIAPLHFCLAKHYNDTGLYEKAIKTYHIANKACNRQFDINKLRHQFTDIINAFPEGELTDERQSCNQSDKPIFIVGMPRSGTSLLEQIIASHPDAYGAGELNNIDIMVTEAPSLHNEKFPLSIANLTTKDLDTLSNNYLKHVTSLSNNEKHVTDKMPHNFMHIGLILKLFPSARIIHCRRHPLDTILSCYFLEFGNMGHDYAYNLTDLAKKYLEYHRLMEHWSTVYKDKIYDVCYENIVTNTENEIRGLLNFCNLEWNESCLNFHQSTRKIHTLSYNQANKPIYSASMFRWKHYSPYIKKLIGTLSALSNEYETLLDQ